MRQNVRAGRTMPILCFVSCAAAHCHVVCRRTAARRARPPQSAVMPSFCFFASPPVRTGPMLTGAAALSALHRGHAHLKK